MTTLLDPALDLSLAPLTNTPLTSSDTTFEIADQAGDIANFPDPGVLGYYAWVWAREPNFPNVGDAARAGFAERVRVTARDGGAMTLTVTRDGVTPIDLNAAGVTYWLVAPMNAKYINDIDDRLFDFSGGELVTTKDTRVPNFFAEEVNLRATSTPAVPKLRLFEDVANGVDSVTIQPPPLLAGDITITLLDALPGGTEFLQIDAAGLMTTTASTSPVTLDDAYDEGGAGAGRVMTADSGPVESSGDGFQSTGLPAVYLLETTDASFNFRIAAEANDLLFQRGDQDADVSDDSFETIFAIDAVTRRIGLNTTNPQDLLQLGAASAGAARLRIQSFDTASDVSVLFNQTGTSVWEAGYDDSAAGFVIGRLTFANPALFIMDGDGRVGINNVAPGGMFEVFSDTVGLINMLINVDANAIGLVIDTESTDAVLLDLRAGPAQTHGHIHMDAIATVNPTLNTQINGNVWFDGERFGFGVPKSNQVVHVGPYLTTGGTSQTLTISGGVVTSTRNGTISLLGEGSVADTLDTLTESPTANTGEMIILRGNNSHTITVSHGTGNILLDGAANKALTSAEDVLLLVKVAANWLQVSFSNNA